MKKVILALLFGVSFWVCCTENQPELKLSNQTIKEEWYEGGTLHKSTITDWKVSEEKNKLATCADFMARVDNTVSMRELRLRAANLKICIDEATREIDVMDNQSVISIAALCLITMGYDIKIRKY